MVRHAASHGLSIFVCTIISAIMMEIVKPLLPELFAKFRALSESIIRITHIPLSAEVLNIVLVASILGIIWGIFFKIRYVKN